MDFTGLIALCIQLASRELGLPAPTDANAKHIIGLGVHDSSRILYPTLRRRSGLSLQRVIAATSLPATMKLRSFQE